MQGLARADVDLVSHLFQQLDPHQQGYVRYALNGSFYTRDKLKHSGVVDETCCIWCDAEDSVVHRHWHCPHTQDARTQLPQTLLLAVDSLPACTRNHGWLTLPEELHVFQQFLIDTPDRSKQFCPVPAQANVANIFTDGSACLPNDPLLRVATWGVVIADLETDTFPVLAQGGVSGLLQTVLRAEIWATIAALEWIIAKQIPAILWVDNQQVQVQLEAFRHGALPCTNTGNDHDLWHRVAELCHFAVAKSFLIKIVKVTSHVDPHALSEPIEAWATRGNAAADRAAEQAQALFPTQFWQVWENLRQFYILRQEWCLALFHLFITVGQRRPNCKSTRTLAVS
jgi:ribonuclease HI